MARIFVVEDDVEVALLVKTLLERDAHAVSIHRDGDSAAAAIKAGPPDLLVLDVMIPGTDGYTLCAKLQEDPRTRDLPVVVITAKGKTREAFKAFPNVAAFLEKPFKNIVLTGMIDRALSRRESAS